MMLALLYEEKQDYRKAIDLLKEAHQVSAKNVDILYQIGMLYEKIGRNRHCPSLYG